MWWEVLWMALGLVLFVLLPLIVLYARRRWLHGLGGVFDCAMQRRKGTAVGWSLGFGRFRGGQFLWYRAFSLSLAPKVRFDRFQTDYVSSREPVDMEAVVLFAESSIVTVADRASGVEANLAMAQDSAMALISWLEAAPPGSYMGRSLDSPS